MLNLICLLDLDADSNTVYARFDEDSLVLVSRGRWMGLGDVKAMFAVGAAFGPLESLVVIFCAAVSALAAAALAGRLRRGTELRFGPHLAAGTVFTLVAGDSIARQLTGS